MSQIQLITFDLDDTLWAVKPALIRAEQEQNDWLKQHRPGTVEHHTHESLFEFKKSVWKRHPELAHHISKMREQSLYELQIAAGYTPEDARIGAKEAFEVFLHFRHKVELYENALRVLELLHPHYTLGAITNGNADVYKTDAAEYFDFAILAEEVGASKPAPIAFEEALKRSGFSAHQAAHIGDHWEHDVLGARNAGFHAIWLNASNVGWPHDSQPPLTIQSLDELPNLVASLGEF